MIGPRFDSISQMGDQGRQDLQVHWHKWAAKIIRPGQTVLDVGSGLGHIKERVADVYTQDLSLYCTNVDTHEDVSEFPEKSFDIVTAFDVIEHVRHDMLFMQHLIHIARDRVIITTPNFNISECRNEYHVREYTPIQLRIFVEQQNIKGARYYTGTRDGLICYCQQLKYFDNTHSPYLGVEIVV